MSISSREKDKDAFFDPDGDKKKYVKIWRIEASREFLLLMLIIIFAIGTSMYNPIVLQDIGKQNNEINKQNLNNTQKIIDYFNVSSQKETASGMDIIKVLLLYNQDHERDLAKIMNYLNISNTHFVNVNGTHAITENGTIQLPYPIDMTGFVPLDLAQNELQEISVPPK